MLKFYTRLQNKKVFEWIMNKIKNKIPKLHYYQKEKSFNEKNYQTLQKKKCGRKPSLSPENCLFLTSLRLLVYQNKTLHLDLVSLKTLVSRILVTWITFLARELSSWYIGQIEKMFKGITHNAFRSI